MNDDLVVYLSIFALPAVVGAAYGRWRWGVGVGVVLTILVEMILIEFYFDGDPVWFYSRWRTWAISLPTFAVCAAIGVLAGRLGWWILRVCYHFMSAFWEGGRPGRGWLALKCLHRQGLPRRLPRA